VAGGLIGPNARIDVLAKSPKAWAIRPSRESDLLGNNEPKKTRDEPGSMMCGAHSMPVRLDDSRPQGGACDIGAYETKL
jgi:hypothetical protein